MQNKLTKDQLERIETILITYTERNEEIDLDSSAYTELIDLIETLMEIGKDYVEKHKEENNYENLE